MNKTKCKNEQASISESIDSKHEQDSKTEI